MTVAVFGGSFSPVHTGHMAVASAVLDRGLADKVMMLPCRLNPLKAPDTLLPADFRLLLLEKAIEYCNRNRNSDEIILDTIELSLPSPSYTCDTLRRLRSNHPDTVFRLLVGGDSHQNFHKWKNPEWIERNFSPIVYPRPGYTIENLRKGWTLLDNVDFYDVSSSQIRESIKSGEFPYTYMPWAEGLFPTEIQTTWKAKKS